jgi:DNA processing protein
VSELALAAFAAEQNVHPRTQERTARFAAFRARFDGAAYLASLERRGVRWLSRSAAEFPPLLRAVADSPSGLFLRGTAATELLARPSVAVVGARACSGYGAQVARTLGRELPGAGLVVVSGLARGVDGEAHRGALEASGATVAVLGCGIDRNYPHAHTELARRIAGSGLIVSEYPPGTEPAPWRFPARNRIVAGLSRAVVVVEARERSGALITAEFALEEGREVLAVPGEITSALSAGTNALLRQGAAPLLAPEDVLAAVGLEAPPPRPEAPGGAAGAVLAALADTADDMDGLSRRTGLPPADLAAILTVLELEGRVRSADGFYRAAV